MDKNQFTQNLSLPLVAAPMFLISGPELVIEACKNGIVGTFPALNQRTTEGFEQWVVQIKTELAAWEKQTGKKAAPFGVNLIVHFSNPRVEPDMQVCVKHKVPLIITSLGAISLVVDAVHSYGGLVFHDGLCFAVFTVILQVLKRKIFRDIDLAHVRLSRKTLMIAIEYL